MKKRIVLIGLALVLGLGLALPALADVDVTATVDKTKTITIDEVVNINKYVGLDVRVVITAPGMAEANAIVNQVNQDNVVDQAVNPTEGPLDPNRLYVNDRFSTIDASILRNIGITGVNQDSGNANNQANAIAIAVTDTEAVANSQADAEQVNQGNSVNARGTLGDPPLSTPPQKQDLLNASVLGNVGVTGVNQSVGNMNNQANAVAIAAGLWTVDAAGVQSGGVIVALAEADLGQLNANNSVTEHSTVKLDWINGSINNNHGVTSVNQSAGNMNNQANIVSISINHPM
jgi:hypothetical protein